MSAERDDNSPFEMDFGAKGETPTEELEKRAQRIIDIYSGPYVNPDYKNRKVPGIWGARTLPLPFRDGRKTHGVLYLAQQFPSMAIVLIAEHQTGERSIIHNFNPDRFLKSVTPEPADRINSHLNLIGNLKIQRPGVTEKILNYMETVYPTTR